ncbi:MFS transporter [Castellaniella sp.]|uniref:MFS transporter n=1 Tax=Castellaniella sp. TaxID=1955812 RepID=UPI002AFF616F|nr:MFS transporter [Castellaniella sp.]
MIPAGSRPAPASAPMRTPRAIHAFILLVASGLSVLVTAILGPSLPQMQAHFSDVPNADYWVPMTMTLPLLVMALCSIFAGALADRIGRKPLMVWATGLYAVVGVAPMVLDSFSLIVASRAVIGMCEAIIMTTSTTMIGDYYSGGRREKFMSLQTTVAAGSAVFLNMLGGMLGGVGWRAPYAIYGVALLLMPLMAYYLWDTKAGRSAGDAAAPVQDEPGIRFRPLLLLGICAIAFLVGLVFLMVPIHGAYLMEAIGVESAGAIGIAMAFNSVGVVAGTLVFGWIVAPRLRVPAQLALAVAIAAIGFLMMASAGDYWALTAGVMVNGFGAGLLLPTMVTWNMRELPFSRRGFGSGAFISCQMFGMFVNPVLVVYFSHHAGGRAGVIGLIGMAMGGLALIALLSGCFCRRRIVGHAA